MGFFKNVREHLNPTPVELESLSPDLQHCIGELHQKDAHSALAWLGAWGEPISEVSAPETFHAVLPVIGLDGRGLLALTSKRLIFSGELGMLEVPMHRLSVSGFGFDRGEIDLNIGVAPNNDPVHEFGVSTCKRESRTAFHDAFMRAVREAENGRANPAQGSGSAADELAKFAQLRDQGVITKEEFEIKKAQLLS